jgi:hypothetical protein
MRELAGLIGHDGLLGGINSSRSSILRVKECG